MNSDAGCTANPPTMAVIGFSARAAAESAMRQGFEVIAVDFCADRDLMAICSAHYRLDDPNWPDLLNLRYPNATLLLTGGMEHRSQWVDRCHGHSQRFGAQAAQLQSMRTLANWEKWAALSEIGWPKTISGSELVCLSLDWLPSSHWLVKPYQSAGGMGVAEFNGQALPQNLDSVYLQQRMPGQTIGVTFLSSLVGSTFLGATAAWPSDKHATHQPFVYRGSYGPIPLSKKNIDTLQRFAAIAGRESGILGIWQADFLLHADELSLLEINPRWSASMDLLDVGLELRLVEKHDASARGQLSLSELEQLAVIARDRALASPEGMLGKLIVYADDQVMVSSSLSDLWWSNRWRMDLFCEFHEGQFADIPTAGTSIPAGGPILTAMASGSSAESIWTALESACASVRASSVSGLA